MVASPCVGKISSKIKPIHVIYIHSVEF